MFRALLNRVTSAAKSTPTTKSATPRRARPSLETLEGRAMPSVSAMFAVATTSHVAQEAASLSTQASLANTPISINPIFFHRAPDLRGLDFHLISSNGKPAHDLKIQNETFSLFGHASFTGEWIGDKNNGYNPVTDGSLQYTGSRTASMTFSWNGAHYFSGTVSWVGPQFTHFHFQPGHWHLDGNVTVPGNPTGGPGHVSGDAYLPILLHA